MAFSWIKSSILSLLCLTFPLVQGAPTVASSLSLIRNKISLYSILIDAKNFEALDQVFTPNASLILGSTDTPYPQNLSSIESFLAEALEGTITLHQSDTQYVEVGSTGLTATALSYGEAVYFAPDANVTGNFGTVYSTYTDQLVFDGKQWLSESKLIAFNVSANLPET